MPHAPTDVSRSGSAPGAASTVPTRNRRWTPSFPAVTAIGDGGRPRVAADDAAGERHARSSGRRSSASASAPASALPSANVSCPASARCSRRIFSSASAATTVGTTMRGASARSSPATTITGIANSRSSCVGSGAPARSRSTSIRHRWRWIAAVGAVANNAASAAPSPGARHASMPAAMTRSKAAASAPVAAVRLACAAQCKRAAAGVAASRSGKVRGSSMAGARAGRYRRRRRDAGTGDCRMGDAHGRCAGPVANGTEVAPGVGNATTRASG